MIFAYISGCSFSYFLIDFREGGKKRFSSGITADLITGCRVCIGLSRSVPAFSDNAQDLSIVAMQSPILARMRALFCDHHKWPHDLCACPIWPYLYGWILMILREWIDWRQQKKPYVSQLYNVKSIGFHRDSPTSRFNIKKPTIRPENFGELHRNMLFSVFFFSAFSTSTFLVENVKIC